MAKDPVEQLGYKRKVSNKPPEPNGVIDSPSPVDEPKGNSGAATDRIMSLLQALSDKVDAMAGGGGAAGGSGESGGATARDAQEARGIFKGGVNPETGEYETGSQRKRRVYDEQGKELFEQRIDAPESDVETAVSDTAASRDAAQEHSRKRREARGQDDADAPETPEPPEADTAQPAPSGGDTKPDAEAPGGGTQEDQWRTNTDQKLEDLAQMILGLPEDIVKALREG